LAETPNPAPLKLCPAGLYHLPMTELRVVCDTNLFTQQNFDVLDKSPMRELCARGRVVPIYSGTFIDEMAWAYRRDKLRDDLLTRWLPFIVETGIRFHEHLPLIWHRELVQGLGQRASTHMAARQRQNIIESFEGAPSDGSWSLVAEAEPERQRDLERLQAQREMAKEIRLEISEEVKSRGLARVDRTVPRHVREKLELDFGRDVIERIVAPRDWRAVHDRWRRSRRTCRYFDQFVVNMIYKQILFATDGAASIDMNAQPDLDLMTFLLDADVFVTNEKGFARRAFNDLWRPRGKVILTSDEFAALLHRM
jgi:hypothetical protein